MKWIGISGSWRTINQKVEKDVRENVKAIIKNGNGIVTGGALNVDSIALDEALQHDPQAKKIKVFIPVTLKLFSQHYKKRAKERIISSQQAEELIAQLAQLKKINPQALIENKKNIKVNKKSYYQRNLEIIKNSDELLAFQVDKSTGTQDTIDKARKRGIPVKIFSYSI
jgi:predicted Rossmann fold nucleotide-binding protein DprA/Smf involved in DNA uptake